MRMIHLLDQAIANNCDLARHGRPEHYGRIITQIGVEEPPPGLTH